jgi:ribosomal protein L32
VQKCPTCRMRKTAQEQVRDPSGKVVLTHTVCKNCGTIFNEKEIDAKSLYGKRWFKRWKL